MGPPLPGPVRRGATATGTATWIPTLARSTPRSRSSGGRAPTSEWLLERRKRAESTLVGVVADCYLAGRTRRMDKLVRHSASTHCRSPKVSRMAAHLDATVENVRHQSLDTADPVMPH